MKKSKKKDLSICQLPLPLLLNTHAHTHDSKTHSFKFKNLKNPREIHKFKQKSRKYSILFSILFSIELHCIEVSFRLIQQYYSNSIIVLSSTTGLESKQIFCSLSTTTISFISILKIV